MTLVALIGAVVALAVQSWRHLERRHEVHDLKNKLFAAKLTIEELRRAHP